VDIQAYIQSGIIETYVLGLASKEEIAELEATAISHPEVQQAIDEFSDALEQQAFQNAVTPPAELKQKIAQAIAVSEESNNEKKIIQLPPATDGDGYSQTKTISIRNNSSVGYWKYVAAASIILFIASAAYNFYLYNQFSEKKEQYQALLLDRNQLQANNQLFQTQIKEFQSAAGMMADPTIAMIKLPGIKGKESNMATVFWDTKTKDVYVMANKLPAPIANKQYQLWAIVDGKPVDAGVMDPSCTSICKMKNIPSAQAFAITLEAAGGSASPSMEQMFVMGKV
jgi:anti-sigma-K factor RskA